jgi:ATP-dependent RNA helicase DDX54/DBP10
MSSVIATPGRFLHLLVEMSLDLRSSELIIYDEADRSVCLLVSGE